jgi:hypothetical protein
LRKTAVCDPLPFAGRRPRLKTVQRLEQLGHSDGQAPVKPQASMMASLCPPSRHQYPGAGISPCVSMWQVPSPAMSSTIGFFHVGLHHQRFSLIRSADFTQS